MKALVTGASSGIGRDISIYLSKLGYDIIAVSRDSKKLEELKERINTKLDIIALDLSIKENVEQLYNQTKEQKIDILVNNAGFGTFGEFVNTDIENEIAMIDTNVTALHILTKLYLKDMVKRDSGHILNVASIAGLMPGGPLMATYYATKSYVVSLSRAIYKELKKEKSNVSISVFCPGPVNTNFNNVAGVKFNMKSISSDYAAKYAIDKMLKNKLIILPTMNVRLSKFMSKISPDKVVLEVTYHIQEKKKK